MLKNNQLSILDVIIKKLPYFSLDTEKVARFYHGINSLERWGIDFFLSLLQKNNVFNISNEIYNLNEIKDLLKISEKHYQIFDSLVMILIKYDYLRKIHDNIYETNDISISNNIIHEEKLKRIISEYPEIRINANFLHTVLLNYLSVLKDEKTFLDILFPSGSFEIIENLYKHDLDAAYYNTLMAKIIESYAQAYVKKYNKPISILEIGAGIGSSSEKIIPALQDSQSCSEYVYTDISRAFTRYAEQRFNDNFHFITYKTLNISESPIEQGFENKKFDLVFATNVLHATKQMTKTLDNIKSLLDPNGVLILNEGIDKIDFATMIYGLTDGWWNFQDPHCRIPGSPFINYSNWEKLLHLAGFQHVSCLGNLTKTTLKKCQDIIVAQ